MPGQNGRKRPKTPKSSVGAVAKVFGTGHPATLQPTKTIKKTHFITPKIVIN